MLPAGSTVVVMASGGGDSMALLHLLQAGVLSDDLHVFALHVNHMIRGEESDADEAFVRDACGVLGIPLHVVRYDVSSYATQTGLNLEDAGRRVRYRFAEEYLTTLCAEADAASGTGRIATGHTRDDRVETFLMRLAQGAGPKGMTSLRHVRGRIVRPLLDCSRDELRSYLESNDLAWREDSSNLDTTRLRARIRHDLVPLFRQINPRFDRALERSLDVLAEEDALLGEMADAFAADFVEIVAGEVRFDRAMMSTLTTPMKRRTVRAALLRAFPEVSRIEFAHVEALVEGLDDPAFAHDLPEGLRAFGEYDRMVVARAGGAVRSLAPVLLLLPGMSDMGPAGRIEATQVPIGETQGDALSVVVDVAQAGEFVVDSLHAGDRMRPLGMEGTKKLSDLLIDAKVPRRQRSITPVVRDDTRIVWLAGVRMAEEYKVDDRTRRAFRLTWVPAE